MNRLQHERRGVPAVQFDDYIETTLKIERSSKMKKKRKPLLKLITTIVLATVFVFSFAQPVLAAEYVQGTEENPAKAAITKVLKMTENTTIPNATFTFVFEPVSVDDKPAAGTNMPGIPDISVSFDGSEKNIGTGGEKAFFRETGDFLDGVAWPDAGVYVYKVTEKQNTWTTPEGADYKDKMSYSSASYNIEVYVDNKADNSGTYVKYIAAILKVKDNGTEETDEYKVDPTPGDPCIEGDYSHMIFMNTYVKKTGGTDPTDPNDTVLEISKVVTGIKAEKDKYFQFSVKLFSSENGLVEGAKYKAYVVENVGGVDKVVTSSENGTIAGSDKYGSYLELEVTNMTGNLVKLKHGQRLVFLDLPVGSSFSVLEYPTQYYKSSYTLIIDGGEPVYVTAMKEFIQHGIPVSNLGESTNSVAFSNAFRPVTPTGISVDNLPYLMIIGVAAFALVGYMLAIRTRRKDKSGAK